MSEIKVNFGSLEAGQAGIMKTHGNLKATLEQLEADLQPMLQTWDGTAREAYYQCKKEWDSAAEQMAQTLAQIGTTVGNAHSNYTQAEQTATNTWS